MNEQELSTTLEKFGLSVQEARLFVLLSRVERSGSKWVTAPDISKAAGKDRVRVYQILYRLQKMGLAESRYGRPRKYSAVPPPTAIRRLMALQETRLTELSYLEKEVVSSLLNISPTIIEGSEKREIDLKQSGTLLIQGLPNVQASLRGMMDDADVQLVANEESYAHLISVIRYLDRRPKTLRIIMASSKKRQLVLPKSDVFQGFKIQQFPADLPTILITDKYCALPFYSLELHRPRALAKPASRTRVSDLVVITDSMYIRRMRQLFRVLEAKPDSSRQL